MLWSTWRQPPEKSRSFFTTRWKSWAETDGLRLPMELTHKTRFFLAKREMMCFLLRGSPSQSLLKQMISLPSIIVIPLFPFLHQTATAVGHSRADRSGLRRKARHQCSNTSNDQISCDLSPR